jgi:2-methylisocitrate lyase-like PEP mutase family enzyme
MRGYGAEARGGMTRKSSVLRKAIMERRAVAVPGAHDALSAKIIERCGFEAIQVSGYGVAGSLLGKPDVGLVQMKDVLDITWNIAQAVDIPVMADVDTGGGNAVNAAWIAERLIAMGVAGMNIEDQVFPKRCGHMAGKEVIDADEMAGKVKACVAVRDRLDPDFIINARTDVFAGLGLDEAIRRCNLYLQAGADLAFIDGIRTRTDVERAVKEVEGPLSVNLMDAISGMKTEIIPIPDLAAIGVGRVSIPVASIMVMHKALMTFFTALKESPTGTLPGQTQWVSSFEEYTDFVGLKDYKALEDAYLPRQRLDNKYGEAKKIVG